MSLSLTLPPPPAASAAGLLGGVAFGAALGLGHGPGAMLHGAWAVPLLLLGGAALALPPLYLCATFAGGQSSAADAARASLRALDAVCTALLGLAVPAAFFSVTLRTELAPLLLGGTLAAAGGAGVLAVLDEAFLRDPAPRVHRGGLLWAAFAVLLGARLMAALGGPLLGLEVR